MFRTSIVLLLVTLKQSVALKDLAMPRAQYVQYRRQRQSNRAHGPLGCHCHVSRVSPATRRVQHSTGRHATAPPQIPSLPLPDGSILQIILYAHSAKKECLLQSQGVYLVRREQTTMAKHTKLNAYKRSTSNCFFYFDPKKINFQFFKIKWLSKHF